MRVVHCAGCGKATGHKRTLGFGTFFAMVITAGFWILAIPFYPQRCVICGQEWSRRDTELAGLPISKPWYKAWWGWKE